LDGEASKSQPMKLHWLTNELCINLDHLVAIEEDGQETKIFLTDNRTVTIEANIDDIVDEIKNSLNPPE